MIADLVPLLQSTPTSAQAGWAMAADIAVLVMAIALSLLAFVAMYVLVSFRRGMRRTRQLLDARMAPVSERLTSISDNVEFITDALRTDVARLNTSVRALSDRLQQASDRMEERIEEFNALMSVVQGEAEDLFLDTAATMRGVRAGARQIAEPRGGVATDGKPPPPPAPGADDGAVGDPADEPAPAP